MTSVPPSEGTPRRGPQAIDVVGFAVSQLAQAIADIKTECEQTHHFGAPIIDGRLRQAESWAHVVMALREVTQ